MNLHCYLRLLRPLHTVLGIAVFTATLIGGCKIFFDCDVRTAVLLSLAIVMPFLVGAGVASAAHAAMHRPFFLLLPDGRLRLRLATFIALALAVPVLAAGIAHWQPVPWPAAFGLTSALTTLPLTNPRRWINRHGGSWALSVALGILLLRLIGAARVILAVQEFPWIILASGGVAAFWSFKRGFAPGGARERAHTPFDSVGGIAIFHGMFNQSAHRRFAQEAAQRHARLVPDRAPAGQAWSVRQVGPDSGSWVKVFQHAAFGRGRNGSHLKAQLCQMMPVLFLAGMPLLNLVMSFGALDGQDLSHLLSNYWNLLAHVDSFDPATTGRSSSLGFGPMLQMIFCTRLCLGMIQPQLAYPISRERLALVAFRQSLIQLAYALVLPAGMILLLSLIGQAASGHFLPGLGLPPFLALNFGILPLLPLLACAGTARHSASRVILAAVIAVAIIVTAVFCPLAVSRVLSPGGLAVIALITTGTLLLLRWRLQRLYRTCDLAANLGSGSQLFGLPVSPPPAATTPG